VREVIETKRENYPTKYSSKEAIAWVRAYQEYFEAKNAEIALLKERVIDLERKLSECEIRLAEWQKS
jgi:hypothetical protein